VELEDWLESRYGRFGKEMLRWRVGLLEAMRRRDMEATASAVSDKLLSGRGVSESLAELKRTQFSAWLTLTGFERFVPVFSASSRERTIAGTGNRLTPSRAVLLSARILDSGVGASTETLTCVS
jgi:hypothetical protein